MRKEKEQFEKIYEGNQKQYLIDNLISDTNYEIRICSLFNIIRCNQSEIKKVKTEEFSKILKESNRQNEFIKKLLEWTGWQKIRINIQRNKSGMNNKAFYDKCSNKGPTITLIKNDKDNIFGGYASISWKLGKDDKDYSAPDSYLFTLTNIYNIEPTKFPSKKDQHEIRCYVYRGPVFGNGTDLGMKADFLRSGFWSNFHYTFSDILGKGRTIFTSDPNNSGQDCEIKEIEVLQLIK